LRVGIVVDGGEGADEETSEIAKYGGAAWRDGVRRQEGIEGLYGVVDSLSVLEVTRALQEVEREVLGSVGLRRAVATAEHAARVDHPRATLATGGRVMEATMVAGNWFSGCRLHFLSFTLRRGVPPPRVFFGERVWKVLKTKERLCEKW
jgi:hypothetical protein